MSIGRLFTVCMATAALIVVLVAAQTVVRDAMVYRAHARAIHAGISFEASLRVMEKLALERGPTFRLLTGVEADEVDRRGVDTARAATTGAVAELRERIAMLHDFGDTPGVARLDVLAGSLDAFEAGRLASWRAVDDGLALPLSARDPGVTQAYAIAELKLQKHFLLLLNGLQARVAMGAPDAASVVQIARFAADLRELAGLQASLMTAAIAEARPFRLQELQTAEKMQGEIDRLRTQIDAAIAYVGNPPALVDAWRLADVGYFTRGRAVIDQMLASGAVDGRYPSPLAEFIRVVVAELPSLIALRDAAADTAIQGATRSLNAAWESVVLSGAVLVAMAAAVVGLTAGFRRRVVTPLIGLTTKIQRLAGGDRNIEIELTDRHDEVGDLARAMRVFQDALIEREQLAANLYALAANATVSILVLDEGRLVFANLRAARWLGYSLDELKQIRFTDLIHPDDRAMIIDRYRRRLAGEDVPNQYETRAITKDGRSFPIMINAFMTHWNGRPADIVFGIDITERKKSEAELVATRANLTDAIESIEHAIALWDSEDRLVLFNHHFVGHYAKINELIEVGLRYADFVRALIENGLIVRPTGQETASLIAKDVARHRRADGTSMMSKLSDGRVIRISKRPARGGGVVGIGIDVTDQLRTEQQLREAVKLEAIGKLTGGMAHDFNNYLAVIMGNLELIKEFGFTDADAIEWIDEARAGALRAAELTRSLLAFARRQPLEPKPTDVNRRIAATAELLRRTLGADVVLTTALEPDLWPVTIDGAQLDASIVNLANNARDAMPRGGRLAIATRNTVHDAAYARTHLEALEGDYVLIEISDSGTGMPPEIVSRAFEPFFSTKKAGHGTGLGLSMVYGFVKQSGGHVLIDSEVGRGTVVRLYLPRDHAARAAAVVATGDPVVVAIGGTETILVVEDNDQMRQMAATTLARRGYRVIEAANGAAALTILDRREPHIDLLFTDIVMPGKPDGHELARLALERWPDIRVLLTSGYPGGKFYDHGIDAPPASLLGKPYELGDLLRAVRRALDSPRA